MVLTVILAEAALELVPSEIGGHPAIRAQAKALGRKPGQLLLDRNHHPGVDKLDGGERRGRPDITQATLLNLLEHPLAKTGRLEVAVHTRDGDLIRIRPDTRLPRGEARFQGLLAKVLREGASNDKEPWLWLERDQSPKQVLAAVAAGPVVRLDEGGQALTAADLAAKAEGDGGDLTVVIGGYPTGDFSRAWKEAAPETVSLWPQPLAAWVIAAEVAAGYHATLQPAG
ncbi:MAG: 16S rRNA methyltransferase [Thermoplasmatota archaeon]